MLGSLADTALDLVASLITLFGVRVAAVPADRDHRFGHGKAEALAALFQVMLIAFSAVGIAWRGIGRLIEGQVTADAEGGIAVSLVAIVATLALLAYQRRVIARTGSIAIETDHVHYQSDLLLNTVGDRAQLVLEQYLDLAGADAAFGIASPVADWGAWRASSRAIDQLMDKEWPRGKGGASSRSPRATELKACTTFAPAPAAPRIFRPVPRLDDRRLSVGRRHKVLDEVEAKLEKEFRRRDLDPYRSVGQVDHPGDPLVETDLTKGKA